MDALRFLVALTAAAVLAACSAPPPPEKSPVEFRSEDGVTSASWGKTPKGTRLEACPLYGGKRQLTIVLAVPNRFRLQSADGLGCSFGHDFQSIGVSGHAAVSLRRRMEKDLKPFEDIGGDDSVSDIEYSSGVRTFGGRRGERLEHRCFCDGQDLQSVSYRAGGVVVGESIPHEPKPMPASSLPIVLPTISVERGVFAFASSGGTTVRLGIPANVDYVSGLEDGIQFGFQKPDYRRIELHVGVGSLTRERNRLADDATVSGIELAPASRAVGGRDGRRLTYDQVFKEWDNSNRVEHVIAFQAGDLRVTVINEPTADHQQTFRDRVRTIT
jgi:hypothetical protein